MSHVKKKKEKIFIIIILYKSKSGKKNPEKFYPKNLKTLL